MFVVYSIHVENIVTEYPFKTIQRLKVSYLTKEIQTLPKRTRN